MNHSKNITTGLFGAAILSIGINNAQASDTIAKILDVRNATIDRIEKICTPIANKSECYTSELRSLFTNLTKKDPAMYTPSNKELAYFQKDMSRQLSENYHPFKGCDLTRMQILLYTDVSKNGQNLSIWLFDGIKNNDMQNSWWKYHFIGASKVSSGYPDKKPRKPAKETKFSTGTGIYMTNPVVTGIVGYRAEGTKNRKGIRGFWEKGNRVYDVGPMPTKRAWDGSDMEIRFMIHSTDPALEKRFWSRSSHGCLRIPKTVNRFLEYSGALDAGYDTAIKNRTNSFRTAAMGLLGWNPNFSSVSGSLIIIGNSDHGTWS